ncbi:hypothetical protein SPWS13_2605 [Shewanella putrefaciens]|nr:hypothetical protein SPWS13_2605 [Shewanella putrefaciens]
MGHDQWPEFATEHSTHAGKSTFDPTKGQDHLMSHVLMRKLPLS